jgi:hypothetical protein
MDEARFYELLEKLKKPCGPHGTWDDRVFTMKEYKSMTSSQLSEVALEMMKFAGPGSYTLTTELYDLIGILDGTVKIREDPNLEKYFHLTASLIYLTQLEGRLDLGHILPANFAKHLERIIGPDPSWAPMPETQPTLQIATFLAYPLLEGVVRRKLSQFISLEGKVLNEFAVKTRRGLGIYGPRKQKTDCIVKYHPNKGRKDINRLDDELRLLEQQTASPDLKAKLLRLDTDKGLARAHLVFDQDSRLEMATTAWHVNCKLAQHGTVSSNVYNSIRRLRLSCFLALSCLHSSMTSLAFLFIHGRGSRFFFYEETE